MPPEHGEWQVDGKCYHADRFCESASTLNAFRRNRREYYLRYVTGDLPPVSSESLALGIALHTLVLEPDSWEREYAIIPEGDGRTKAVREKREEFDALLAGRTPITVEHAD